MQTVVENVQRTLEHGLRISSNTPAHAQADEAAQLEAAIGPKRKTFQEALKPSFDGGGGGGGDD